MMILFGSIKNTETKTETKIKENKKIVMKSIKRVRPSTPANVFDLLNMCVAMMNELIKMV